MAKRNETLFNRKIMAGFTPNPIVNKRLAKHLASGPTGNIKLNQQKKHHYTYKLQCSYFELGN